MIRHRMAQLDSVADRAIELLREPKPVDEVAGAVLELVAQTAGSQWAAYWVIDAEEQRLRPIATWKGSGPGAPPPGNYARHCLLPLSFGNAAIAWCGRKPVWSISPEPDRSLSQSGDPVEMGRHGGVWFALKTDTAVYGVIELLGPAFESKAPDSLMGLERLGFRLGHALEKLLHGNAAAQSQIFRRGPLA